MKKDRKNIWVLLVIYALIAAYVCSENYTETLAHIRPAAYESLSGVIYKSGYTDEDYALILRQTGLGRAAADRLRDGSALLKYQAVYFADTEYECVHTTPVSFEEYVPVPKAEIVTVEDGDILVTTASHILSWRNGHAAIVTDAEKGRTLEAVVIGSNTAFQSLSKWEAYPNFKVLRLKNATAEERAEIADAAEEFLGNKPYNFLVGVFPRKYTPLEDVYGTQCAHLVWLAYASFGYDIDSDGGMIVTPKDIAESGLLELVQTYG